MIVRALRLRHGRIALPRASSNSSSPLSASISVPTHLWRQYATSHHEFQPPPPPPGSSSSGGIPADQPLTDPPSSRSINPFAGVLPASESGASSTASSEIRSVPLHDPDHPVAQRYAVAQHQKEHIAPLGSTIPPHYKPHELLTRPPRPEDVSLELLLASGAHLGHATPLWHPANAQYIFGVRGAPGGDPIHIISLDVTASHLRRACRIVEAVAASGGLVLFVGTRRGQARAVVKAAELARGCHLFGKWVPGTLTNGQQILGKCALKVVDAKDDEVAGYEAQLPDYGVARPDLVVCLNPLENYVLLRECGQEGIPTIGVIDTDCNPTWVTYPIPANDDSARCVQVIAGALGRAGEAGQKARLERAAQGIVDYVIPHRLGSPQRRGRRNLERRDQALMKRPSGRQFTEADVAAVQLAETAKTPEEARRRVKDSLTLADAAPEELEGVDVVHHEQDEALLAAAEASAFGTEDGEEHDRIEHEEQTLHADEDSHDEPTTLDPSLLPENPVEAPTSSLNDAAARGPHDHDDTAPDVDFALDDLAQLAAEQDKEEAEHVQIADPAAEPDPATYRDDAPSDAARRFFDMDDRDGAADDDDVYEFQKTSPPLPPRSSDSAKVDDDAAAAAAGQEASQRSMHSTATAPSDQDEAAPAQIDSRVNDHHAPTATDPTAREEAEDAAEESPASSTWEQVTEVERELGETEQLPPEEEGDEVQEGGETLRYEKGEAVKKEQGWQKTKKGKD